MSLKPQTIPYYCLRAFDGVLSSQPLRNFACPVVIFQPPEVSGEDGRAERGKSKKRQGSKEEEREGEVVITEDRQVD